MLREAPADAATFTGARSCGRHSTCRPAKRTRERQEPRASEVLPPNEGETPRQQALEDRRPESQGVPLSIVCLHKQCWSEVRGQVSGAADMSTATEPLSCPPLRHACHATLSNRASNSCVRLGNAFSDFRLPCAMHPSANSPAFIMAAPQTPPVTGSDSLLTSVSSPAVATGVRPTATRRTSASLRDKAAQTPIPQTPAQHRAHQRPRHRPTRPKLH